MGLMMKKILIVEDEVVIASDIQEMLEELNYEVVDIVITAKKALEILATKTVDLVLLDIHIKGNKDGVELAQDIQSKYNVPFIFLTSHADPATVERAIQTKPIGYVVKPFEKADLFTSISLALNVEQELEKNVNSEEVNVEKDYLFVKDSHRYIKVHFNELLWLKATGNYIELHCENKKHLIRSSFKELVNVLPENLFFQIHKSYIVQSTNVDEINGQILKIGGEELPIGRSYKKKVLEKLLLSE